MKRKSLSTAVLLILPLLAAWAQETERRPVRRAQPPRFDPAVVRNIFFDDLFAKDGPLNGPRPSNLAAAAAGTATPQPSGSGAKKAAASFAWSKVISAETIEGEVKQIAVRLNEDVTRPAAFARDGHHKCRVHFSVLAMMFAITNEYDEDVRWKTEAAVARDLFSKTAANCKTNSSATFNAVRRQRDETLQTLLGGSGLQGQGEEASDWSAITDRGPLMTRLQEAAEENLQRWTASASEFEKHLQELPREAELVAAFAIILCKEGMEDAGDDEYMDYAKSMQNAALSLVDAVKLKNQSAASKAVGQIRKACGECHSTYQ
ncbi:MAG: cytochrome c [Planctomycetota bacterium]|nr:cytochrome c [Planctomycetota bacterium]